MKRVLLLCLLFACLTGSALGTTLTANMTVDDNFDFYISTDDSSLGTYIGSGVDEGWRQNFTFAYDLTPGVTNYLHVVGWDTQEMIAAFLGDFTLSDTSFEFRNGTQSLLTDSANWDISNIGFGQSYYTPDSIGPNSDATVPWVHFVPGISGIANWIWSNNGYDFTTRYFSSEIVPRIDHRTLTTSSTGGGTVSSPGIGSFLYDHGTVVPVVATPQANYHFVNWTGSAVTAGKVADPLSASTTVTMDADYTLQANFEIDRHTLTVTTDGIGSATGSGTYDWGSNVPVAATPNAHWHFVNWTGTGSVTIADPGSASTTVTIDGDGIVTAHFAIDQQTLTIDSTAGGYVKEPGEGTFQYPNGELVLLMAKAKPLFVFVGWSGTYFDQANTTFITIDADHQVKACFESILDVLYVDDNAPGDPGPGDSNLSDPNENGTSEHPFDTIQEAIDVAREGIKVIVRPGTYLEVIDLLGKSIEINGLNSDDSHIQDLPIIDGQGKDTVVRCGPACVCACDKPIVIPSSILSGLVITGGRGRLAGGIVCSGSNPSFVNCLIVGNRAIDPDAKVANGGAVYCQDSQAAFVNCTISGNYGDPKGAGLWFQDSGAVVVNSIIWGNGPVEVLAQGSIQPVIGYCDVAGGWTGVGNLDSDPLFVMPGYWADPADLTKAMPAPDPAAVWVPGDYHLMSAASRWDPADKAWVVDTMTSPCIDAGDVASPVGQEPSPNGERVNLGAYGGMSQASLSQ